MNSAKPCVAVRAKEHFEMMLLEPEQESTPTSEEEKILRCYCHLLEQIGNSSHTLGKDGKFQLFVCLCARFVSFHYNNSTREV